MENFKNLVLNELDRIDNTIETDGKIAVFDLDNTLIDGDISDTIFTYMMSKGFKFQINYQDFLGQIHTNTRNLFRNFPTYFEGIKRKDVIRSLEELLEINDFIFTESDLTFDVKTPKAKPEFVWLINELSSRNYLVSIVSASPDDVVKAIASAYFNLEHKYLFGIKSEFSTIGNTQFYTNRLIEPVPVFEGKETVFTHHFEKMPIISAGDSVNDLHLLNLTSSNGLIIICNEHQHKIDYLKSNVKAATRILTLNY